MSGLITLISQTHPSSKPITVSTRPARLEDAEGLARLYFASYDDARFASQTDAAAEIERILRGEHGEFYTDASPVVVDEHDRIVAAALCLKHRVVTDPKHLPTIYELFTAASRRREGLAEQLIRLSIDQMHQDGYEQVSVRISENNAAALALYLTLDFNRWFPEDDELI
ncbi:MAG: GNAT family N-acetyltransferase [Rothia sp. (in: high G+C Gram-positive bacteria)]|uniref:GNAT family N-acetyltransferase n=1 Tax=Rothia sp. (in: high G+C Gram-positive bacteria) TaxID=1885016 RepID=UPI0026F50D31|nr:GNAT family N-acetyltransferase [Rothia sp. (in: high G+C Gram-positive bacteria)]